MATEPTENQTQNQQNLERERNLARAQAAAGNIKPTRQAAGKRQAPSSDPDYPYPISLRSFIAFGFIAVCQDLLQLGLDLLGVGWLIGYLTLPLVWVAYWYIIIRWAPKPVKRKLWQRSALMSGVEIIPVVGDIIPGWTATAVGAYVLVVRYEMQKRASGHLERAVNKGKPGQAAGPSESADIPTASSAG